ncbi:MAG: prepilin-type N-terminal cleavage/methylation domain-containing protein [Patescibacteria group bacterium]
MPNRGGFTIIELLVVIGISVILAAAATPLYGSLQISAQLNDNTALIIQSLRTARELSVAGYNFSPHGVYFDNNVGGRSGYTLYQGNSYATRLTGFDKETIFDEALITSSTNLNRIGADIDINFSRGTGVPSNTGTLRLIHSVNEGRAISINSIGKIEEE